MNITFNEFGKPQAGALAVGVLEGGALTPAAKAIDKQGKGFLKRAIEANARFTGGTAQILELFAPPGTKATRLLAVGLGKPAALDAAGTERVGAAIAARLLTSGEKQVTLAIDRPKEAKITAEDLAARLGLGARLRSYRFDLYRTKQKKDEKPSLQKIFVQTDDVAAARRAFRPLDALADGITFTRDLVSEPANILYPAEFARRVKALEKLGLEVEILGEEEMRALKMGALIGVGEGSQHESQLVVMRWQGAKDQDAQPIAFVGKGVCFDTGGISLKPGAGMWDMKWDMAGAGAVAGLMHVLAARKAAVNAVGVLGLVENMPDGKAQRPGDVVTSMSGQTIEVLNTDAEGRLVLADAVYYTADRFKPRFMVDLATLTGAILIALGHEYAGLFADNEELAERLLAAGTAEGEKLWRMPLTDGYDKQINSPIADVKNISGGRDAGSSIGAHFIQRFTNKVPWAHLDIAGMAWSGKARPSGPEGATGFGVRLLNRLVEDHYEER
ncbi:MAG: leucyl aminopeptidase [Alphaproteobacteria bacterium]|nr:leucyl aminopeptidase [Alphaproteobacteria bacterium]